MLVSARAVLPSATRLSLAITVSIQNHPPPPALIPTGHPGPRPRLRLGPALSQMGSGPGVLLGGCCPWSLQESW